MSRSHEEASESVIVIDQSSPRDVSINLLPCAVEADCPAPVAQYFDPTFRDHKGANYDYQTATFRGRELAGREVSLPAGFRGVVLREQQRVSTDLEDRHVTVTGTFDKLQYWNLETVPSANDKFVQALQWIDIAAALHQPVKSDTEKGGERNGFS